MILPDTHCAWALCKTSAKPFYRDYYEIETLSFNLGAGFLDAFHLDLHSAVWNLPEDKTRPAGMARSTWKHVT